MKKHKVIIEFKAGSEFQEEFMKESLEMLLGAFRDFSHSRHKKNSVTFEIE